MASVTVGAFPFFASVPYQLIGFELLPLPLQYTFAAVLGAIVGSFLGVVAHRLPLMLERDWQADHATHGGADSRVAGASSRAVFNLCVPASGCPRCGHALRPWENIPVVSYVLLRGRCAACRASISPRYPALEVLSAALAVCALWRFGPDWRALAAFALAATLVAASAIDANSRLLPDILTLPLLWAGLLVNLGGSFATLEQGVIGAVAGYLFLWALYWIFRLVRGTEGIGYGDFKLLAALGAWLGWAALPQVVLLASLSGAIVGLLATWRGRMRFSEPLPFGPFLGASGVFTLLCGTPFYRWFGG